MCGIVGIFNNKEASKQIAKALQIIKNRGKDGVGIASSKEVQHEKQLEKLKAINSENIIGHCLHSIVHNVPQPIKKEGMITSNNEIYNWKELKEKHQLKSKNDSELLVDLIEKQGLTKALKEVDGVYAFVYWKNDEVYLVRDIIGVKPVWYSTKENFCFCSEKKALESLGYQQIEELNPRTILIYNTKTKEIRKRKREFFSTKETEDSKETIRKKTEGLLLRAIEKRLPDKKFGILFSGGIDSTIIAYVCRKLKRDFICYTAGLEEEGMSEADDIKYAKKIAKEYGLTIKVKKLNLEQTREHVEKVVPLIEDNNVVKVGVALTFYAACQLAKKDKVKVIYSGLGSEEIFAGYERHKKSQHINKECLAGLRKMYERDLYRDDVITMNNNLELRLPFLDKELVQYALTIPEKYKLSAKQNKIILRDIAKGLGIKEEFSQRPKKAAQYGSKFDRALQKLAKKEGYKKKSNYLYQFYHPPNVKLGVLWSSGKDSAYAAWTMKKQNYEISCLISLKSKNPDSYMFHTPAIEMVKLQAEAMSTPLILKETKGEKEAELQDLKAAIKNAKEEYKVQGIVTGALYSNYQRDRIEKICDELELKIFSPLWHMDQETEMRNLVKEEFSIVLSSIAAFGLDRSWVGRKITQKDIDKLKILYDKYKINIAGEGGEFESLVLDCPLFEKKIEIIDAQIKEESENSARLNIVQAKLR